MNEPKNHHYVSRAYLSGFTDPATPADQEPYLWVYERGQGAPYARSPKKTAVKRHYYRATLDNGTTDNVVEDYLGRIESSAIPVLRKLDQGTAPSDLSAEERAWAAYFITMQHLRVPQFRTMAEKFMADLASDISLMGAAHPESFAATMREAYQAKGKEPPDDASIEATRQFVLSKEWTVTVNPVASLQHMVQLAPELADYPYLMRWRVLEAPAGQQFVTSDAPVVRVSTLRRPAWMGLGAGWESPWMEATFPLSPRRCLLLSHHHPEGKEPVSAAQVAEVNLRTASFATEQVYSATPTDPASFNWPPGWTWWRPVTAALVPSAPVLPAD